MVQSKSNKTLEVRNSILSLLSHNHLCESTLVEAAMIEKGPQYAWNLFKKMNTLYRNEHLRLKKLQNTSLPTKKYYHYYGGWILYYRLKTSLLIVPQFILSNAVEFASNQYYRLTRKKDSSNNNLIEYYRAAARDASKAFE